MPETSSPAASPAPASPAPASPPAPVSTVSVTIDGRQIDAQPGELVIAAAQRHDIFIPRFCYHERMSPVGMCRMCLVEIDTGRGPQLQPSCMVPVADAMTVDTQSALTRKVQEGVLEQLLINHPLDCPVCDKGGECSLQDQTLAYGPGESRFVEEKRHFQKPIPVSQLVDLDRERCILCDRCTRFADEVAGDPLITFTERGNNTQVLTFPDEPFSSYFSGNTVEICPVGALTASPYRFKARPWDLREADSTCTTCSVGCGMAIQSSHDQLVRFVGMDVDAVNHGWLCDKGRFSFEAINSEQRITAPQIRAASPTAASSAGASPAPARPTVASPAPASSASASPAPVRWNTALTKVAQAVNAARPGGVAIIGGARGTNEDAYAWAQLAHAAFPTGHLDAQLNDGLPASLLAQLPAATIDEVCQADTVLLLAGDIKEELPVLYLRLRAAASGGATQLVEVGPLATGLRQYAHTVVECLGGEIAIAAASLVDPSIANSANRDLLSKGENAAQARSDLAQRLANGSVVVVLGRGSLAESDAAICEAAQLLAQRLPHAKFLPVLRRANVRGALAMGLSPERAASPAATGPSSAGPDSADPDSADPDETNSAATGPAALDATGILTAAKQGNIDVLFLLGADPVADFFDTQLAADALSGAGLVVAVDAFNNSSVQAADVVLPAALFGEKDGTTTNLEGRVRLVSQLVTAPGAARPDWLIAAELARHCGHDLGFVNRAEITQEIASTMPGFAGIASPIDEGAPAVATQLAGEGVLTSPPAANSAAVSSAAVDPSSVGPDSADPSATSRPIAPPRDSYALRLTTTRSLYDAGVAVSYSPSLAQLPPGPALLVNPSDFARVGVAAGTPVQVRSGQASVSVPVFDSTAVSRGNAVLRLNQPASQPAGATASPTQPDPNQPSPAPASPASYAGLYAATDQYVDVHIGTGQPSQAKPSQAKPNPAPANPTA